MEIVFAGFGGQGVLTSGLIISQMAMEKGKNVTWMPAYGPTMRGGKAYSVVKYSDEEIGGPDMEEIDIFVCMNEPSLEYLKLVKKDGLVVINSDAISSDIVLRDDVNVLRVECVSLAKKINNLKAANIITLGIIIKYYNLFDKEYSLEILDRFFAEKGKDKYSETNRLAFNEGYNFV